MTGIDETHAPALQSWVESANGHPDFPLQNLPFGIFATPERPPAGGVAIGDQILDLGALAASGQLTGLAQTAAIAASGPTLNSFFALGPAPRRALRAQLSTLLRCGHKAAPALNALLVPAAAATMHLPCAIGDYTDFYAGINHALNIGRLFRPDTPLLPNYRHMPIGYHGRASTIRPSGTPVARPRGQTLPAGASTPVFGPSRRLDFELELGIWIGAGNTPGEAIPIAAAADHIAGYCLLNDWSARDIQAWEYQPLGPFLSKNFATTISCWVITPEALAPFRRPAPERAGGDPPVLPYLLDPADQAEGGLAVDLNAFLHTEAQRRRGLPPHHLTITGTDELYWTAAQMVAHHTANGCALTPGDLFGSGTISGTAPGSFGSLMETTANGANPLNLASGETRGFLEDGDEVSLRATAQREGFVPIGFGDCRATVRLAAA